MRYSEELVAALDRLALGAAENFQNGENGTKNTAQMDGEAQHKRRKKKTLEDKYYARQIDNWDEKDHGGSFRVGKVSEPLLEVGIPDVDIWFDQSKVAKQLEIKSEITKDELKKFLKSWHIRLPFLSPTIIRSWCL